MATPMTSEVQYQLWYTGDGQRHRQWVPDGWGVHTAVAALAAAGGTKFRVVWPTRSVASGETTRTEDYDKRGRYPSYA